MMEISPNSQSDDAKKRRFLWGVLLAWIPFFFFVFPAIFEISTQKATGLGAVAGGLAVSSFGLAAGAAFEVAAIVLLVRAFSQGHPTRTFFSVISVCCSGLTLAILGLCLWFFFRLRPY